ncbi:MAG: riboflavin biosynthesis protein RibF [Bacilli bacterium]
MEIVFIDRIEDIKNYGKLSVAHGFFDGLHKGHTELIKKAKDYAKANNLKTGVVTFDKKISYLVNNRDSFLNSLMLSTFDRKIKLIAYLGVDIIFVINFSNFKNMDAKTYIDTVIKRIGTNNFVMGEDNFFGKNGGGNCENIFNLVNGEFRIDVVKLIERNGIKISSSKIKDTLFNDNIEITNELLGYYYQVSGKVVLGKQFGRSIDYPTANIKVNKMIVLPKVGVYATIIKIDNNFYKSMTNIGFNPTVDYREDLSVETFIFDFNKNIYNKDIELYFVCRIRDEVLFNSIDDLIKQLHDDECKIRKCLESLDESKII